MAKPKKPRAARFKTHDAYIADVARLACRHPGASEDDRNAIRQVRLAYGDGQAGVMGITRFNLWKGPDGQRRHWCAVCATCQPEGSYLIAETVLHELGHAIAGPMGAHGPIWRSACERLGLIDAKATYAHGDKPVFSAWMAAQLAKLKEPTEGRPAHTVSGNAIGPPGSPALPPIRPCGAGIGTKGGKSRGPGSGTRNALHVCGGCKPPVKVRAAISKRPLSATCDHCKTSFSRV